MKISFIYYKLIIKKIDKKEYFFWSKGKTN